ncbi:MAG: alanine aminotransferase, partial [Thermoplasmata archaeon]
MIKASKRSSGVSYAIRDLVVPAKELERKGYKILHLNIGDPNKYDFDTPPHMKEALYQATLRGENGYSPSEGYPELIESIIDREKKRNNVTYTREHICITSGVTESLQMFLNASLDPGDEILIPGPTYPQYRVITKFNDAEPIPYRCIEEEGWQPDIEDIRKRITKKTKAIVIINPNNPTGAVYPANVIKKIID